MVAEAPLSPESLIANGPFDDFLFWGPRVLSDIRRIVLDVLKPHRPSIIELSRKLTAIKGVDGVNCVLEEVDQETESVTITLEGTSVDFDRVEQSLREAGAVIHSIDEVAIGKKLVEPARTPPT